jgi:DNA-binding FadR family transcriptional regulator
MPNDPVSAKGTRTEWLHPPRRLADDLYESLVKLIAVDLPAGARLPPETALAERFGVSRPTVRETLARMREEGLIVSRRGSGSYVAEPPASTFDVAPAFSAIDSFHQIKQAYEFRKAVEGEAAFVAASSCTDDQLRLVRLSLVQLEESVALRAAGPNADFAFHLAVARASGNTWFANALLAMKNQIEVTIDIARKLSLGKSESHLRDVQNEHVAIYDAIARHDAEGARSAMRDHLTNTCNRIFHGQSLSG